MLRISARTWGVTLLVGLLGALLGFGVDLALHAEGWSIVMASRALRSIILAVVAAYLLGVLTAEPVRRVLEPSAGRSDIALVGEAYQLVEQHYVDKSAIKPQEMAYAAIRAMLDTLGDGIVAVDGEDTAKMPLEQLILKVRGPTGQPVRLSIQHQGEDAPVDLTITREQIQLRSVTTRYFEDQGILHLR